VSEPRDYDGPNPYMYDKHPCRCGSSDAVTKLGLVGERPGFSIVCASCGKHTKRYRKLIDAVHRWNEMNEREGDK